MDYRKLINGIKRFGSSEDDICLHGYNITKEQINDNVIIAPCWEPNMLPGLGEVKNVNSDYLIKVWNIKHDDFDITYIKTEIGSPMFLEGLLPLGITSCKCIIFIGSVGSMDSNIGIGDIVIPEFSVCGDGTSRYLASDDLSYDVFGDKVFPDNSLQSILLNETSRICDENKVCWHIGKNFSVDTISAQYAHIDTILNFDCNTIEMETAVAFRAAKLMNIPLVALFSVSDNTITNKSLISGRTQEEMEYRKFTRRELFPKIILSTFKQATIS